MSEPIDEATALRDSSVPPAPRPPRFTPGAVLADRYRIVALLGKGGMGEVYRAEDIKLGQPVALKFLPLDVAADRTKVERLYHEVRIGRQVSHPNVCRLYDIGEWEGNHFVTMEYVDGEDLASLLRRIGKLPEGKAIDIARDLCAGLAAAHGLGIIHRDLKPANVMIDGRGMARVTDFGLAGLAVELSQKRELAGTPAYMAPEQLTGGEITPRTDLYALGLILFEMFTGKRRFESRTVGEIVAEHSSSRSSSVTTETKDIDPAIQRVIVRCLEEDPKQRPASIHSVIAALPGGDPLQAALDAGETPSPEMVAAAGAVGDLSPRVAWSVFSLAIIALIAAALLSPRVTLYGLVDLPKSPDVLRDRAKEILAGAGYREARDSAIEIEYNNDFFKYVSEKDRSRDRWTKLRTIRPGVMLFAYRQSPRTLIAQRPEGKVWVDDPPAREIPGMAEAWLDMEGRLVYFFAVPPQKVAPATTPPQQVDWMPFFAHAGLDISKFQRVPSVWTAFSDTDARNAWEGRFPDQPDDIIRVEAGSYRGRPVLFAVIGPWVKPVVGSEPRASMNTRIGPLLFLFLNAIAIIVSAVLARRNLHRGRVDRRGAFRAATFMFVIGFAAQFVRLSHVSDPEAEWALLRRAGSRAVLEAGLIWLFYIAIEPYVRRFWPHVLISWTRLLSGRVRDPMVGRDLLVGTAGGLLMMALMFVTVLAPTLWGAAPLSPMRSWTSPLTEVSQFVYAIFNALRDATQASISILVMLFLLFLILRRRTFAAVVLCVLLALQVNVRGDFVPLEIATGVLIGAIALLLLTRFGVLAVSVAIFINIFVEAVPLTFDSSAWYFGRSAVALALIFSIAAYGFYFALAGKPILGKSLLEDEA